MAAKTKEQIKAQSHKINNAMWDAAKKRAAAGTPFDQLGFIDAFGRDVPGINVMESLNNEIADDPSAAARLLLPRTSAQPKQSLAARELQRRSGGGYVPAYEKYQPSLAERELQKRSGGGYVPAYERYPAPVTPEQDAAARPYAYQQPAVRNAFTMGAPADDARARIKAEEARIRFNSAEESFKSLKTPEAEAAYKEAQADAERWGKWAAMSPVSRKQVLMNGERAANAAQGRDKFATLRNEMDTPGAAELLAYAANVNAGRPSITETSVRPDGTVTGRQMGGRYGSGSITGLAGTKAAPRTALSLLTDNLLLDQAAQAGVAPGRAADILKNRRY